MNFPLGKESEGFGGRGEREIFVSTYQQQKKGCAYPYMNPIHTFTPLAFLMKCGEEDCKFIKFMDELKMVNLNNLRPVVGSMFT